LIAYKSKQFNKPQPTIKALARLLTIFNQEIPMNNSPTPILAPANRISAIDKITQIESSEDNKQKGDESESKKSSIDNLSEDAAKVADSLPSIDQSEELTETLSEDEQQELDETAPENKTLTTAPGQIESFEDKGQEQDESKSKESSIDNLSEDAAKVADSLSSIDPSGTLSEDEQQELDELESQIKQGSKKGLHEQLEIGRKLSKIKDKRLYRILKTFDKYCKVTYEFTSKAAYFKIAAATIYDNLSTNGRQILPTSERQLRDLATVDASEQIEVWDEAVKEAGGKVPSSSIVRRILNRRKKKSPIKADFFKK
jgi:hypothetical protein